MIRWVRKGKNICCYSDDILLVSVVGEAGYDDILTKQSEGVYLWVRRGPATDHMCMEVHAEYRPDFTMVPGLNYNGNGWGTFCEYVTDRYHGEPWKYGWHRASVASMTYSESELAGRRMSVAFLSAQGLMEDENSCQIYEQGNCCIHRICWPEEETPKVLNLYSYDSPYHGCMEAREEFRAILVLEENAHPRSGYRLALDMAWEYNKRKRPQEFHPEEIWKLGIDYACTLFTREADGFCGFNIGLAWEDGEWKKRAFNKYEIGWCGQNAMLANALLTEALLNKDGKAAEMGFDVLDSWIGMNTLPAGVVGSYYDPGQIRYLEACDLGTAGLAYFEAYDLSIALDREKPQYLKAAMDICEFALQKQRPDGEFAKCYDSAGNVAVREGTVGAFMVLPLTEGYKRSGKAAYLEAADRGLSYYLRELREHGFTTAGALDIFSIDKESGIPLLKGAIAMYELTGQEKWLEAAIDSAWYLSTWQYTHTCRFGQDSILGQTGYDSFGGTLVSTVHEGIDPFALCYIPELYRLWEITGEDRWYRRAAAIWRNGCQHISDGTRVIDGKKRPAGSQDESYTVTRQGSRGIASQWLVAWPGSFRMEVLRRMGMAGGRAEAAMDTVIGAAEDAVKDTVEDAVKDTVEDVAKDTIKDAVKDTIKNTIKDTVKGGTTWKKLKKAEFFMQTV